MTLTHSRQTGAVCGLLLLAALLTLFLLAVQSVTIQTTLHSDCKHPEAVSIRKCLDEKGPYQTWASQDGTFFRLCQLPDRRWGIQVIHKEGDGWFESSAYIPKDGTWREVIQYLSRKAVRWTGELP